MRIKIVHILQIAVGALILSPIVFFIFRYLDDRGLSPSNYRESTFMLVLTVTCNFIMVIYAVILVYLGIQWLIENQDRGITLNIKSKRVNKTKNEDTN